MCNVKSMKVICNGILNYVGYPYVSLCTSYDLDHSVIRYSTDVILTKTMVGASGDVQPVQLDCKTDFACFLFCPRLCIVLLRCLLSVLQNINQLTLESSVGSEWL